MANKLNAKCAMQMKVNIIIGHHSIYFQMPTNGPHLIFAAHVIENGMIL